jgi:hypothetical protein
MWIWQEVSVTRQVQVDFVEEDRDLPHSETSWTRETDCTRRVHRGEHLSLFYFPPVKCFILLPQWVSTFPVSPSFPTHKNNEQCCPLDSYPQLVSFNDLIRSTTKSSQGGIGPLWLLFRSRYCRAKLSSSSFICCTCWRMGGSNHIYPSDLVVYYKS